jgi:hypothetical protein
MQVRDGLPYVTVTLWIPLNTAEDSYAHTCRIPIHRHRGTRVD